VVACRNDSKRQHGHLLPQVSLAIFTQSVDEQAYLFLASQSGALRISAYRDFQPNPNPIKSTYSFRAFQPFFSDQKQCM